MTGVSYELEQQLFVEEVGLILEHSGLPRMAGRILGWLLICDPPHQSPGDLAGVLEASKGSISTMTRLLVQAGLIERMSLPGQRRVYFRMKPGSWSEILRARMGLIATFRQVAERGLALLNDHEPEQRRRLEEMHAMYAFFEREFPLLIARWEEERLSQTAAA